MSQIRFLGSGSVKGTARTSIDLPVDVYGALLLVVFGTTDTGETLAGADIGRLRIVRDGRQIHGESFEFYHDYTAIKKGFPAATLPTAGASRIAAAIPFSLHNVPNALDVRSKEEVDVHLEFDAVLDTRFGANAGTFELYGILKPGVPELYELQIFEQDMDAGGAQRLDDVINGTNIAALYLRDPDAVVDTVQVQVDGRTEIDNVDDEVLLDVTNLENMVEASGNDLLEVSLVGGGQLQEALNKTTSLSIAFSGAGTLEVTAFRVAVPAANQLQDNINRAVGYLRGRAGNGQAMRRAPAGAVVR